MNLQIDNFERDCLTASLENQLEILQANEKKLIDAPVKSSVVQETLMEVRHRLTVCKSLLDRLNG